MKKFLTFILFSFLAIGIGKAIAGIGIDLGLVLSAGSGATGVPANVLRDADGIAVKDSLGSYVRVQP
jgi:hypothetical protein